MRIKTERGKKSQGLKEIKIDFEENIKVKQKTSKKTGRKKANCKALRVDTEIKGAETTLCGVIESRLIASQTPYTYLMNYCQAGNEKQGLGAQV